MANRDKQMKFENGEVLFFEHFFKEYFPKFYAFATRFVEDSYVCEDIVQEVFVSVWESTAQKYDSQLMLQAYMYRAIRNRALNYLKHHKIKERYAQNYLEELGTEAYMLASVLEEEAHFLLYEAIGRLTPQCRQVIKLHLEGKSNKEIAEEMQITVSTVKTHKMVAYKELRDLLKDTDAMIFFFLIKNMF